MCKIQDINVFQKMKNLLNNGFYLVVTRITNMKD
jgi:hypothetical protein